MRGLYNKYTIGKADGTVVDEDAVYFVLRLDKGSEVLACRRALREFAFHCKNEQLAKDCYALVDTLESME